MLGSVQQRVGRSLFSSFFDTQPDVACDGTAHPWSGVAPPENGIFRGGHAQVEVQAQVCNATCTQADVFATVSLSGGKK